MNNSYEKNITKKLIENQKYFEFSFDWYYQKYLDFFWQKRLFFFLSLPFLLLIIISITVNYKKMILNTNFFTVSAYIKDSNETVKATQLSANNIKDPNLLIAKYLINRYISIRESLEKNSPEFQKKFILNNSSSLVYFNYKKEIENIGENNLFLNKKYNDKIYGQINNIQFLINKNKIPYKAIAQYTLTNPNYPNESSLYNSIYKVEIDFVMDNIFFINKESNYLNFIVLNYKTYKL